MNIAPFIMIEAAAGGGGGGAAYLGETFATGTGTVTITLPGGLSAADTVVAIAYSTLSTSISTMSAPSGWTAGTGASAPTEPRSARIFTAPGNIATLTFTETNIRGVLVFATSEALRNSAIEVADYSSGSSGANRPNPAVTASADDLVVAAYIQLDDGTLGPMVDPGSPQAGYTREYFSNAAAPYISILSQASMPAGSTGTIAHDANGAFSNRVHVSASFGA